MGGTIATLANDSGSVTKSLPFQHIPPSAKAHACQSLLPLSASLRIRHSASPNPRTIGSASKGLLQALPPYHSPNVESHRRDAAHSRFSCCSAQDTYFGRCDVGIPVVFCIEGQYQACIFARHLCVLQQVSLGGQHCYNTSHFLRLHCHLSAKNFLTQRCHQYRGKNYGRRIQANGHR